MIKITTDSTCDLPSKLLEEYDITVTPLGVAMGDGLYRDGVDITIADIAAHVDAGGEITTTSAVSIGEYHDLFSSLRQQYDAVIHINLGAEFSCCHQNAKLAAMDLTEVYAVDSANLTVGSGALVLSAARAARTGKSAQEIVDMLEDLKTRIEVSFVLNRLDYMKKGGRCSAVMALGANLLKLHPCIEVVNGRMSVVKKYRGSMAKVVSDFYHDRLDGREDIALSQVWVVDTAFTPELPELAREIVKTDGRFAEVLESKAGCTIFSHCGPETVGLVFFRK